MEFCPTCGNMLLYELPHMERPARFYCPTCPYVCQIESKIKIKRHLRLVKKPIDPIFSEDDRKNLNKTTGVSCPDCNHGEASFTQVQTSCFWYWLTTVILHARQAIVLILKQKINKKAWYHSSRLQFIPYAAAIV
ncbi:hypothetical protein Sango_0702100 [Sesamum angolense]|uniref:DNA-directed RNA polymerase II subunit RPB9-like zinc ribbon domain-containing protein n=1 Tax=Sesamum angolense TaxID=2727404 RepID=A0AAE1X150_9LAMI|nr:hypothetical protein Sango_0702100 [Sesamum angolense]